MEGGMIERGEDGRAGNKRGRDEKGNMGRLEKRPSGIVVVDDYNGDEMINGVKYEEEKKTGGGLFNQLIANLVSSPKSNHQVETEVFDAESVKKNGDSGDPNGGGDGGEGGEGGEGGGVINNLISNIFHSNGSGGEEVVEKDGGVEKKDTEKDEGGNIIDSTVSRSPKTEDAAPATDEASILIHSIIHD